MQKKQINVAWVPCHPDKSVIASARLRAWYPGLALQNRGICDSSIITSWDDFMHFFNSPVDNKVMVYQRTYSGEFFNSSSHMCKKSKIPIVMDLCDVYPTAAGIVNIFADLLVTATSPRVDDWKKEGITVPIGIVGDMPDYDGVLHESTDRYSNGELRPVWFGTYSNIGLVKFLAEFTNGVVLSDPMVVKNVPASWGIKPWSFDTFKKDMSEFNLCLLPQTDTGKSVNKFATALSCGLPVIASAIPSYKEVAEPLGVDKFLCETMDPREWNLKINQMRTGKVREKYNEKVKNGYEKHCGGSKVLEQWMHLFGEVLK